MAGSLPWRIRSGRGTGPFWLLATFTDIFGRTGGSGTSA